MANGAFGVRLVSALYSKHMRRRFLPVIVVVALALSLALLALTHGPGPRRHPVHPPADTVALPRALDLGPLDEAPFAGRTDEVMPMHRAVRLALRRFDGKVLDIGLVPAPPGIADAHPLIYRIRILTRSRDVLDIRMDAFTGRFLELRGADIGAARRTRKDD